MGKGRRGPSLFEVMNKSPQTQNPSLRPKLWPWGRGDKDEGPALVVAERLTEEEAAAELAAEAARKREAERAKRAAKQAAAEKAERAAKAASGEDGPSEPRVAIVRTSEGRVILSLNTVGCIASAACLCLIVLGAFALGRRANGVSAGDGMATAAALAQPADADAARQPLSRPATIMEQPADSPASGAPDVRQLLETPSVFDQSRVVANEPARVEIDPRADRSVSRRNNYLQIESFRVTRERSGEQLAEDVADVQAYLAQRGVATFARRFPNRYVLYSEQGFPPDSQHRAQRNAFRDRVAQFGKEYRKQGGLYEFKGCLFVSYSKTVDGQPVR